MRERTGGGPGTRHRLAAVGVAGVLLAMLAAVLAFNAFERSQIRAEAEASVDDALGWEIAGTVPPTRIVAYFYLDEGFGLVPDGETTYSELDARLAAWCADHAQPNVVQEAVLGDVTCYVEMAACDPDPGQPGGATPCYLVCYVDISSQLKLVGTVNVALAIIAVVGAAAAGAAGWHAGVRIEAAEAARRRFYENMSHELKTPLAAMRGYAEGMGAGLVEPNRAATSIIRESERMTRLIEEILSLSRMESGAVVVRRETVDVGDFTQDCLMPFEGIVRTRGLLVELDLAPGNVEADPGLFSHALENVVSNAVRHAATVVRAGYDGRCLWVENDGTLPDAAELEHLFERFRTGDGGGTGIGLALAREVAELHGWRLRADLRDDVLRMTFDFARDGGA